MGYKFSCVLLALSPCVLIQKYRHVAGLGLVLKVLASALALASTFWPRLTSLFTRGLFALRHQLGRNVTARLAIANYFLLGHPLWYILVNLPASVMPAPLQRRQYYLTLKKQITFWTQASEKKTAYPITIPLDIRSEEIWHVNSLSGDFSGDQLRPSIMTELLSRSYCIRGRAPPYI